MAKCSAKAKAKAKAKPTTASSKAKTVKPTTAKAKAAPKATARKTKAKAAPKAAKSKVRKAAAKSKREKVKRNPAPQQQYLLFLDVPIVPLVFYFPLSMSNPRLLQQRTVLTAKCIGRCLPGMVILIWLGKRVVKLRPSFKVTPSRTTF